MEETEFALVFGLILALVIIIIFLVHSRESRARKIFSAWADEETKRFSEWKKAECESLARIQAEGLFVEWKSDEEKRIRADAIRKSREVVKGRVTEHMLPVLPGFPFDPRDARFLGSPVDFVVFSGLYQDVVDEVVFVEVKSGTRPRLTKREELVRRAVEEKRVRYLMIHESSPVQNLITSHPTNPD